MPAMHSPHTRPLPGDLPRKVALARMLRVDHAGEYGATRIYAGQMAALTHHAVAPELAHMAAQEQAHLAAFNQILPQHRVRPSALLPFCHLAGFALGAGTAMLGATSAMACTVAVESVITEHYDAQLAQPNILPPALHTPIQQFRDEEMEHHDLGLAQHAEQAPAYGLLHAAIRVGCKAAIWLCARV